MDKKKSQKIAAITVTFNTSQYVIRAIEAIEKQTRKVDNIVVVDNCSSEAERSRIENYICKYPNIELIRLDENTGGAGGFSRGMEYARNSLHPDWFWLMDDDACPEENCLEELLKGAGAEEDVGCLIPLIRGMDRGQYQMYHYKRESRFLVRDIPAVGALKDIPPRVSVESSSFVGPLIAGTAVEKLGIVDGSLFIYGDDLEYIYRISRRFKVYLIRDAVINHRDILTDGTIVSPLAWWKDYYQYRNRLFFITKYAGSGRERLIGKAIFGLMLVKRMLFALIQKEYAGYRKKRIRLLWMAWQDGNHNKRGRTIDPVEYCAGIKGTGGDNG